MGVASTYFTFCCFGTYRNVLISIINKTLLRTHYLYSLYAGAKLITSSLMYSTVYTANRVQQV